MRKLAMMLVFGVFVALSPQDAAAQGPWEDRVYMNVNFGVESGDSTVSGTRTGTVYDEEAQVASTTNWTSGGLFDVGVGVRVFRNLSAGIGYHQESNVTSAEVSGSIPHPVFFNRPRSFLHNEEGLERKELATHLVLGWTVPIGAKLDVMVFGGPSFFRLSMDVVSDFIIAERSSPYTEVVVDPTVTRESKSVVGYNVGADVSYMAWENDNVRLGAGVFFRYTGATAEMTVLSTPNDTKVGGLQFGFGGRVRF